jgi:hypothetical protein
VTRRVTQAGEADCALACMAMLTGRPLRAITSAFRGRRSVWSDAREHGDRGGGLHRGIQALKHLGFTYFDDGPRSFIQVDFLDRSPTPNELEVLTWGRRAMLSVRSRRGRGWHMVYWDGHRGYDPSPFHRRNKTPILSRQCRTIYLFREV